MMRRCRSRQRPSAASPSTSRSTFPPQLNDPARGRPPAATLSSPTPYDGRAPPELEGSAGPAPLAPPPGPRPRPSSTITSPPQRNDSRAPPRSPITISPQVTSGLVQLNDHD